MHENAYFAALASLFLSTVMACDAGEEREEDNTAGTGPSSMAGRTNPGAGGSAGSSPVGGSPSVGGGSPGGSTSTGAGVVTGMYGHAIVTRDGQMYVVQNNVWGTNATQQLSYTGTAYEVTQQTGTNPTNGAPVSYPSAFIGSNFDRRTTGSNLPKLVSSIASIDTGWFNNAGPISGTYNAAYDVWFSTVAAGDQGAPTGGYLMVWFYDPPNAQPLGSAMGTATIPGISMTWTVWKGTQLGKPCISYVANSTINGLVFDLNLFIKDAVQNHPQTIQNTWYLTNVFAGFEIWSGGVGLKTTDFYAVVK